MQGYSNAVPSNTITSVGIQSGVKLYVFTPVQTGVTVIRPYVYNFNDNMVNGFVSGNTSDSMLKQINGFNNSTIVDAILPSANGIELSTSHLDNLYSFVLVIDNVNANRSEMAYGGPKSRTVMTGYFYDEPFVLSTLWTSNPVLNEDALMVFTHNDGVSLQHGMQYGAEAPRRAININAALDVIPQSTDQYVNANLAMCDISSIANSFIPDPYSEESVPTSNRLELSAHNGVAPVTNHRVKSPKHQLIDIAQSISQAKMMAEDEHTIYGGSEGGMLNGSNPHDVFVSNMFGHLQRPETTSVRHGLNPAECIPIGKLSGLFPMLEVVPCEVPFNPTADSMDQRETTIQSVYSSLVTNVVSSIAMNNILSSIGFRYGSWNKTSFDQHGGSWEIQNASLIIGEEDADGSVLSSSVNKFMLELESALFPILIKMGGEFDMMVKHDSTGHTVVDLNFLDFVSMGHGFYTTQNKLGGMVSPALGTIDNAINNKAQLDGLISNLSANGILDCREPAWMM